MSIISTGDKSLGDNHIAALLTVNRLMSL
jgi:hypothetical protein